MTDDLEQLLQATEGQPPSDEFVARLRAQIVAETEGRARETGLAGGSVLHEVEDGDDAEIEFDLLSQHDDGELAARRAWTQHRTQLLAAAAAVATCPPMLEPTRTSWSSMFAHSRTHFSTRSVGSAIPW